HASFSRDWSSDVCSSDLVLPWYCTCRDPNWKHQQQDRLSWSPTYTLAVSQCFSVFQVMAARTNEQQEASLAVSNTLRTRAAKIRSEERRVGKEWRSGSAQ